MILDTNILHIFKIGNSYHCITDGVSYNMRLQAKQSLEANSEKSVNFTFPKIM